MYELIFNQDTYAPALRRVEAGLADPTELYQDLGELLVASTQDRILEGLAPDGTAHAPRSEVTLARYAKRGLSFGKPLNQSGEMRQQIHYEADAQGVSWGSNAIQAAVMQFGAAQGAFGANARGLPLPWGNIPARPFIGFSEEDEINVEAEILEWLDGLADGRD
ncbi:phage virion morphogenesis protein [Rhodobacteraceae bacterium M382]|nr:phage virion morphogenesis protein [Rhodobacteraceae bacterium M382]